MKKVSFTPGSSTNNANVNHLGLNEVHQGAIFILQKFHVQINVSLERTRIMHLSRFLMTYMYQILFTNVHSILYVSDCVIEESAITIIYPLSRSKLRGLPSHPAYTLKQHLHYLSFNSCCQTKDWYVTLILNIYAFYNSIFQ